MHGTGVSEMPIASMSRYLTLPAEIASALPRTSATRWPRCGASALTVKDLCPGNRRLRSNVVCVAPAVYSSTSGDRYRRRMHQGREEAGHRRGAHPSLFSCATGGARCARAGEPDATPIERARIAKSARYSLVRERIPR